MSHYNKTGEDPSSHQADRKDENYASPSHYDDTGQQAEQTRSNSNYADTSGGTIRLNLPLNRYPTKLICFASEFYKNM